MYIDTQLIEIDIHNPKEEKIEQAANILKNGGLLAFPTETVYGLGADATSNEAAKKIYAAKGRPSDNPLIVHIADIEDLPKVAIGNLTKAKQLAKVFWPGPLTLVLEKSSLIPYETTGGLDTVAVRMPDYEITRDIIRESGLPIAAPSANISGRPSPTMASHVLEDLNGVIDGIVDAGTAIIGLESTIVDLTGDKVAILRKGFITGSDIQEVLGEPIEESRGISYEKGPKAPGMKYKHYAPKAELSVVTGKPENVSAFLRRKLEEHVKNGKKIAIIGSEENSELYDPLCFYCLGSRKEEKEIMHNLYATLRLLDEAETDVAYIEDYSDLSYGDLLMERITKASNGRIINTDEKNNICR